MGPPSAGRAQVKDAMHAGVITCRPGATLRMVAGLLAEHRIHAVVVASEESDAPCIVVTDRDVVFGHSRGNLDQVTARDAANEPTITVRPDSDLLDAAVLMAQYGTSHVIVTESGSSRPVGILSSLDIAAAVSSGSA